LKLRNVEELIAGIGYGEYSAENVLNRIRTELKKPDAGKNEAAKKAGSKGLIGTDSATLAAPASSLLTRRSRRKDERVKEDEGETQSGHLVFRRHPDAPAQEDLLYSIARCCAPIFGDEVRGYITRGR